MRTIPCTCSKGHCRRTNHDPQAGREERAALIDQQREHRERLARIAAFDTFTAAATSVALNPELWVGEDLRALVRLADRLDSLDALHPVDDDA